VEIEIRGMRKRDWPAVSQLIETEWEARHPVLDEDFFLWQHMGFGNLRGLAATPLAFVEGTLVGMRGIIPGEYQLPRRGGGYEYASGGAFAMWIVANAHRGLGIGKQLLHYCDSQLPVMLALGSNEKTSVPIYLKNGFSRLDGLNHWFAVLSNRANSLLYGAFQPGDLPKPARPTPRGILHSTDDAEYLSRVWERFSRANSVFSLHKKPEFWEWRYLNHPVFNHEILYNPKLDTFSVQRIEEVDTIDGPVRVLRILDLVTGRPEPKSLSYVEATTKFLELLLSKLQEDGVHAVDFRVSHRLFEEPLRNAGFHFMPAGVPPIDGPSFAGQLNPLRLNPSPINLHWKTSELDGAQPVDLHFTKSDSDMDRPNTRGIRSRRLH